MSASPASPLPSDDAPSTHERELTEPVELCTADGKRLRDEARGWSRRPLHAANLRGRWGRTKRWDYWALLTDDLAVAITYADVDYLGLATVWWADLASGESGGREVVVPFARGLSLPEIPGDRALSYRGRGVELSLRDELGGTRLKATWQERDDRHGRLEAFVELPPDHGSVNVVIPWSETRFQYTSKHQARPAHGELVVGDRRWDLGERNRGPEAWGVLDVGRGRWPYRTRWNWGGGAGHSIDGEHVVGLQVGGRWTAGTGATENGIIVDGQVVKLGRELDWHYDWDDPLAPWRVADPAGPLELTLVPRYDRHARTNLLLLATEVHQVFGRWSGRVPTPDGGVLEVRDVVGFAEESRSRW
jgi:hypothetical protein